MTSIACPFGSPRVTAWQLCTFDHVLFFMGPTGFDSDTFGEVSMSGVGKIIRDQTFQTTTGEEHFALAA
jgi:hypothetical protein